MDFDRIVVRGREHPLSTTPITVEGPDDTKRDVAVIAGSTAAGAVIGEIMSKGAKKGAVVGAATGTGAVLVTRGKQVKMPVGLALDGPHSQHRPPRLIADAFIAHS